METEGLVAVRERIAAAAHRSGRTPADITLVAVSKGRPDAAVRTAYDLGQRAFGENRQQGLASRLDSDLPTDIAWHFIGPLQRRKAKFVATHASLLHSFDREALIPAWSSSTTPVLIQFNMAGESQKGGFEPNDADRVLDLVLDAGISVRGVMAIPPAVTKPDDSRRWFAALADIHARFAETSDTIDTLSMGMSHDFEVAIEEGATMVRVGTAIFGGTQQYAMRNR